MPFSDSEPSVRPWKACSAYRMRGRPVAAREILIAASTASVPVFAGTIAATLPGARASSCSASTPEQQRHAELRQVAGARVQHVLDGGDDVGVVAPDGEHAVAAEQVEVALAGRVDQVRPLAAGPGAVETQRAQDAPHLRVEVTVVERQLLAPALGEHLGHRGDRAGHTDRLFTRRATTVRPGGRPQPLPDRQPGTPAPRPCRREAVRPSAAERPAPRSGAAERRPPLRPRRRSATRRAATPTAQTTQTFRDAPRGDARRSDHADGRRRARREAHLPRQRADAAPSMASRPAGTSASHAPRRRRASTQTSTTHASCSATRTTRQATRAIGRR